MANKNKIEKVETAWREETVISEKVNEQERFVVSVIQLLDMGATIPFIARYRKENTGDMAVDKLREVASQLEDLRAVQTRMCSIFTKIASQGKMTRQLEQALRHAQTMDEVEMLYAPYKTGHKGTLAERAKALGLEPTALNVLSGKAFNLNHLIKPEEKGVSTIEEVETGIKHIMADVISKDKEVMEEIRKICSSSHVTLESKQLKGTSCASGKASKAKANKTTKAATKSTAKNDSISDVKQKAADKSTKFEQYFDFQCDIRSIKPHQVLAINRGVEQKVLAVKVVMPDGVKFRYSRFAHQKFICPFYPEVSRRLIEQSIEDSFDRLVEPQMCRQIRSDLTKVAEKASVGVFCDNLHRLLLTPPVKGKVVLGIDPGFKNGCKAAVLSANGQVLQTVVMYLHDFRSNKAAEQDKVVNTVKTYRCDIIAIGNGVACRETEQVVAGLIQSNIFHPLSVVYCIVDEGGASIYSVSDEAQKELPDLDQTLRGAVSIARRLQDPLSELVKIEPKHIGVGMYQHDVAKNKLQTALDSVVEECVSFTGVDLNTASQCLLRRVAGLNAARATKIIDWRRDHGLFTNRSQLLMVKGLGEKTYEQCAGFVRVILGKDTKVETEEGPSTAAFTAATRKRKAASTKVGSKGKKAKLEQSDIPNPLDMTAIHPESYSVAERFILNLGLSPVDVGNHNMIQTVQQTVLKKGVEQLAEDCKVGVPTMKLIVEALSRPVTYDFRSDFQKPLFKKGMTSISDLKPGAVLTGRVTNVTHFGAFVDIGVGQNGLIHVSKMRPPLAYNQSLGLGDHVEVCVVSVEPSKNRIGLQLQKLL